MQYMSLIYLLQDDYWKCQPGKHVSAIVCSLHPHQFFSQQKLYLQNNPCVIKFYFCFKLKGCT